MQAAIIERLGEGPSYREVPRPAPAPGQVLVRVGAASLNPVDLKIAAGTHYGGIPQVPYIPGSEGVGVVAARGSELNGKRVRFQVAGGGSGALAGWTAVDPATCLLLPDRIETATAAALGVAGLAAWISLVDKVHLQTGERVLILGATGPVGQIAVQIARLLGAGRIVAAARDAHALATALDLGAHAAVAINGQSEEALRDEIIAAAKGPLEVVFDPLWGTPLQAALAACGPSARVVHLGDAASKEATISSSIVRGRQLTIIGHSNPNTKWEIRARAFRELADHAADGRIRVQIEELPLSEVTSAWERQASSPHVKLVLRPSS